MHQRREQAIFRDLDLDAIVWIFGVGSSSKVSGFSYTSRYDLLQYHLAMVDIYLLFFVAVFRR